MEVTKDTFTQALRLASHYHAGQKYGDSDYMYHINSVIDSVAVSQELGSPRYDLLSVAALHDILEDTEIGLVELTAQVGVTIAMAVFSMTKFPGQSYESYITRVKLNSLAREVKIHDTLCNLTESVQDDNKGRIIKYSKQLQLLVGD